MENEITNIGMTPGEFGKKLIEAAQQQQLKQKLEQATGEIVRMNQNIEILEEEIKRDQESIALYGRRLQAISEGKFSVVKGSIVYEEESLNIPR